MRRRSLLRGAAALALAAGGCASGTPIAVASIADDIALVGKGLALLAALPPLAGNAAVRGAVSEAEGVVAALAAAAPQIALPTAQTWVATLVHDADVILPAISAVPGLPPQITEALAALPVLLAGLQGVVALAPMAATAGAVRGTAMTPDQARRILRAL